MYRQILQVKMNRGRGRDKGCLGGLTIEEEEVWEGEQIY